ncbi:MAG: hypothetical protein ABFC96_07835 [Thermoguttaceae bacterium]
MQQGKLVELCSPFFVFRLDTTAGLRAQSWENRLAGQTLKLGDGPELDIDIGLPDHPLQTPPLVVSAVQVKREGETGEVVFTLAAKEPALSALVTYRWNAKEPVLRKFVEITNKSDRELNRLLNVRLGTYRTAARLTEHEQGFPAYLDGAFFTSLAHPAGWATAKDGQAGLRQYPGIKVPPGKRFECMEAVYGVAKAGEARKTFVAHVRSRMRRALRGHDKPYAIFEAFGSNPTGQFHETEKHILDNIAKVAEGQRQARYHFDFYSIEFWVDRCGDLKRFDPVRFPNRLTKIRAQLAKLGIAPALWIDSGGNAGWSIGWNPAVKDCVAKDNVLCRATEPIQSMYVEAFRHHIRHNGVRLLKFDNLATTCSNPKHEHLPGIYSTEPIENAQIELLHALDAECPDVFLILYWGHRSPWWLLHGDTLFDSGLGIEAASPSDLPAPHIRDSITQKMDQAQWVANQNVPPLGKDSLGVWLSDWSWNSQVGKERWQGGFVMDLCRGSMLAQPWSDTPWLSPPERKQMADFIALLKARPECFGNPRFILGDPAKNEPYGYCCTDGKRAFLALHNSCWKDSLVSLELNSTWGLPDGQAWDLCRWYPEPARLQGDGTSLGNTVSIALRPFDIVLLEVVPHGQSPSLNRSFPSMPISVRFSEPSRTLDISVTKNGPSDKLKSTAPWTVLSPTEATSVGGVTLTKLKDTSILASGKNPMTDTWTITANTDLAGITAFRLEMLPDPSLPGSGPGRACNGNFLLNEFRVKAWPRGNSAAAASVTLHDPVAEFARSEFGKLPVAAAIDGDPKTFWSVDPFGGLPHTAIFHARQPIGVAGGTTLQFTMEHGQQETGSKHTLGRLRLWVTTAKPPVATPKPPLTRSLLVRTQTPASRNGGTLVVAVEMTKNSAPLRIGGLGKVFSAKGKVAAQTVAWQPVLGTDTPPSCWQAWRTAIEPSAEAQLVKLEITTSLPNEVDLNCSSHFLPK